MPTGVFVGDGDGRLRVAESREAGVVVLAEERGGLADGAKATDRLRAVQTLHGVDVVCLEGGTRGGWGDEEGSESRQGTRASSQGSRGDSADDSVDDDSGADS